MLELVYLSPPPHSLDMAVATFIGNLLSVAATGFVLIPLVLCAFEWWLLPRPIDSPGVEAAGVALIVKLIRPVCCRVRMDQLSDVQSSTTD